MADFSNLKLLDRRAIGKFKYGGMGWKRPMAEKKEKTEDDSDSEETKYRKKKLAKKKEKHAARHALRQQTLDAEKQYIEEEKRRKRAERKQKLKEEEEQRRLEEEERIRQKKEEEKERRKRRREERMKILAEEEEKEKERERRKKKKKEKAEEENTLEESLTQPLLVQHENEAFGSEVQPGSEALETEVEDEREGLLTERDEETEENATDSIVVLKLEKVVKAPTLKQEEPQIHIRPTPSDDGPAEQSEDIEDEHESDDIIEHKKPTQINDVTQPKIPTQEKKVIQHRKHSQSIDSRGLGSVDNSHLVHKLLAKKRKAWEEEQRQKLKADLIAAENNEDEDEPEGVGLESIDQFDSLKIILEEKRRDKEEKLRAQRNEQRQEEEEKENDCQIFIESVDQTDLIDSIAAMTKAKQVEQQRLNDEEKRLHDEHEKRCKKEMAEAEAERPILKVIDEVGMIKHLFERSKQGRAETEEKGRKRNESIQSIDDVGLLNNLLTKPSHKESKGHQTQCEQAGRGNNCATSLAGNGIPGIWCLVPQLWDNDCGSLPKEFIPQLLESTRNDDPSLLRQGLPDAAYCGHQRTRQSRTRRTKL